MPKNPEPWKGPTPEDISADYLYQGPLSRVPPWNAVGANVWVEHRGKIIVGVTPYQMLLDAHKARTGESIKFIEYVRACLAKNSTKLYIYVTDQDDPLRTKVTRNKSRIMINVSALLTEAKLAVEAGYQEKYPVTLDPTGGPGPAILIDLQTYTDRRVIAPKSGKGKNKSA